LTIGIKCITGVKTVQSQQQSASNLDIGPIIPTETKPKKEPIEIQTIREIKSKTSIPIVAMGGISMNVVPQIKEAGAAGISVISSISQAKNSKQAAEELQKQLYFIT